MKLIFGLGNPGQKYNRTRHNVGFEVVDYLQKSNFKANEPVMLVKPQTFMNSSGEAVYELYKKRKCKTSDIIVIHDDLDIPLGEYKIQLGKGPKIHNGVNSIEKELGSNDFWRVRIGVDNREAENRIPGDKYVLDQFENIEFEKLEKNFPKIATDIINIINGQK